MPPDAKQAYFTWARTRLPVRRVGTPEDLAEAIVLAATNRYITGTVITCDGGARLVAG